MTHHPLISRVHTSKYRLFQKPLNRLTKSCFHLTDFRTTLYLRSAFFWDVSRRLVLSYRRFGTTCRPKETDRLLVTTNDGCVTSQKSDDLIYTAAEAGNTHLVYVSSCVCIILCVYPLVSVSSCVCIILCVYHLVCVSSCVCIILCLYHLVSVSSCVCILLCLYHLVSVSSCVCILFCYLALRYIRSDSGRLGPLIVNTVEKFLVALICACDHSINISYFTYLQYGISFHKTTL